MEPTKVTAGDQGDPADRVYALGGGPTFTYEMTGGLTASGPQYETIFEYEPTGGPITGGSADVSTSVTPLTSPFVYVPTGGIVVSGYKHFRDDITYVPWGGVNVSGSAIASTFLTSYSYVGSGGVNVGGIHYVIDHCYIASGGVLVGGGQGQNTLEYIGQGGIGFSGSAGTSVPNQSTQGSGGITMGGTATDSYTTSQGTFEFYTMSGGVVIGGQYGGGSSAPATFSYTGSGGITTGGAGDYHDGGLGGIAVGSGGATMGGAAIASTDPIPVVVGRGGVTMGGQANAVPGFNYNSIGNIYLGGFGDTPATSEIIIDEDFTWNVLSSVNLDQQFEWSFGEQILYFYQVQSACEPQTCDRSIVDDGSDCKKSFTTLILAPNVTSVCEQLTAQGVKGRLSTISKFSRAAYTNDQATLTSSGLDQTCNTLLPEEFCQIPQCTEFCIDYDVVLTITFNFLTNQQYVGQGMLLIGGAAVAGIAFGLGNGGILTPGDNTGNNGTGGSNSSGLTSGGITMGGASDVQSTNLSYTSSLEGGPTLAGSAVVVISHFYYMGSGGVSTGGMGSGSETMSTSYNYTTDNRTVVGPFIPDYITYIFLTDKYGTATLYRQGNSYVFVGCRQIMISTDNTCPDNPDQGNCPIPCPLVYTVTIVGFYESLAPGGFNAYLQLGYPQDFGYPFAIPGYDCSNYANAPNLYYGTPGSPYRDTQWSSDVLNNTGYPFDFFWSFPPYGSDYYNTNIPNQYYHAYQIGYSTQPGDVGVTVTQDMVDFCSFFVSGSADCRFKLYFNPSGAGTIGPTFAGVQIGGAATATQASLGHLSRPKRGRKFSTTEAVFKIQTSDSSTTTVSDADIPVYVPDASQVTTLCDCDAVSQVIQLRNNYNIMGKLSDFLTRNSLTIPGIIDMSYNTTVGAWQNNMHLSGVTSDGSSQESWNIASSWQCTSILGGTDQGSPLWVFGGNFTVTDANGDKSVSRIILSFSKDGPCLYGGLDFDIAVNTQTMTGTTDPAYSIFGIQIQDSIGLFRSPAWMADPILEMTISEITQVTPVKHISYSYIPIFPDT
jgi:hypothetical protein